MKGRSEVVSVIMLTLLIGMVFSSIIIVEGEPEAHDLEVSLAARIIDNTYNHLKNGSSTVLNVTVVNQGDFVEYSVTLQLLINGTIVLDSLTLNLAPDHVFWASYYWAPEEGDYNLTAYAPPVENETYIENNNDTKWVRVCPDQRPIANFTFEPEIEPNIVFVDKNVTFDASTSNDDLDWGTIVSYNWDWDDATTNTTIEPSINHTFHDHGTCNVTLIVVDNKGNDSLPAWQLVTVEKKPCAYFTVKKGHTYGKGPPPFYVNDTLTFDASDSEPDGGHIVWYHWDFNDTTFKNTTWPKTSHNYTSPGTYNVTLTIADNNTLTDSYHTTIDVEIGFPLANFTIYPSNPLHYVCDPLTFDASASYDSDWGQIISYDWDFNDSTPVVNETDPVTYHHYVSEGEYTVTLTVTDNSTLTSTPFNMTLSISLRVYLKVEPRNQTVNPGEKVLIINITIANVTDLKYFEFKLNYTSEWLLPAWPLLLGKPWEFVGGSFLGPKYGPSGMRWNLREEADQNEGFIRMKCNFTDIVPLEERTGSGPLVDIMLSVKTTGNSSLNLTETLLLNSDDDEPNIPYEVEHGYFYTTWPVANFTYSPKPVEPNKPVAFNASSSYDPDNPYDLTPGAIANYTWDFGDATNDTGMIINHTFTPGVFPVNLTVTDDEGETWCIMYLLPTSNVALSVTPCLLALNETTGLYETAGILPINVTVTNNMPFAEAFTVTLKANDTTVGTRTTDPISPGCSESLTFDLYAFFPNSPPYGLPKGNYNISAHVSGIAQYADHLVEVYLAGDVDRDGDVDLFDAVRLLNIYGEKEGGGSYDVNCDLDCDGDVDLFDAVRLLSNYGSKDP
jgi:PKD repeat protein